MRDLHYPYSCDGEGSEADGQDNPGGHWAVCVGPVTKAWGSGGPGVKWREGRRWQVKPCSARAGEDQRGNTVNATLADTSLSPKYPACNKECVSLIVEEKMMLSQPVQMREKCTSK